MKIVFFFVFIFIFLDIRGFQTIRTIYPYSKCDSIHFEEYYLSQTETLLKILLRQMALTSILIKYPVTLILDLRV